jgi:hypothetical protein
MIKNSEAIIITISPQATAAIGCMEARPVRLTPLYRWLIDYISFSCYGLDFLGQLEPYAELRYAQLKAGYSN